MLRIIFEYALRGEAEDPLWPYALARVCAQWRRVFLEMRDCSASWLRVYHCFTHPRQRMRTKVAKLYRPLETFNIRGLSRAGMSRSNSFLMHACSHPPSGLYGVLTWPRPAVFSPRFRLLHRLGEWLETDAQCPKLVAMAGPADAPVLAAGCDGGGLWLFNARSAALLCSVEEVYVSWLSSSSSSDCFLVGFTTERAGNPLLQRVSPAGERETLLTLEERYERSSVRRVFEWREDLLVWRDASRLQYQEHSFEGAVIDELCVSPQYAFVIRNTEVTVLSPTLKPVRTVRVWSLMPASIDCALLPEARELAAARFPGLPLQRGPQHMYLGRCLRTQFVTLNYDARTIRVWDNVRQKPLDTYSLNQLFGVKEGKGICVREMFACDDATIIVGFNDGTCGLFQAME